MRNLFYNNRSICTINRHRVYFLAHDLWSPLSVACQSDLTLLTVTSGFACHVSIVSFPSNLIADVAKCAHPWKWHWIDISIEMFQKSAFLWKGNHRASYFGRSRCRNNVCPICQWRLAVFIILSIFIWGVGGFEKDKEEQILVSEGIRILECWHLGALWSWGMTYASWAKGTGFKPG